MKRASAVPAQSRVFGSVRVFLTDDLVTTVTPFSALSEEMDEAEAYVRSLSAGAEPVDQGYSDTDDGLYEDAYVRLYVRESPDGLSVRG